MTEGSSLKLNFVMNAILAVSELSFSLLSFPYVSRVLLPEGTGKVSFAVSLISYFNMFAQMGIPTYGIRICARLRDDKKELSRTSHELLFCSLCMGALSYLTLTAAMVLVPRLWQERQLYLVVGLTILLNAISMEWLYRGLERYTYITVRSVACKLIALISMFLLIQRPEDYVIYGGITVLASSGSYIFNLFHARRYIQTSPMGGYRVLRHLKPAMVFFAIHCAALIYTQLDTVMLGFMAADTDVGYYSAAVQIKAILTTVTATLGNVLLPRSSYYIEHGRMEEFKSLSRKALHFVFVVASPMTLYFILFAHYGIGFMSGPMYAASVPVMRILMPTVILIGITNILGIQMLVSMGRERVVLVSEVAGALTDLIINLLLIPKYKSVGAAVGTLVAEAVVLAVQSSALRVDLKELTGRLPFAKIGGGLMVAGIISVGITEGILRGTVTGMMERNPMTGAFFGLAASGLLFFGVYGIVLILAHEPLTQEALARIRDMLYGRKMR